MSNKDLNELTYDELIKLIDKVKMCSGCDEVELFGSDKTFEELIAKGFPLDNFKHVELTEPFKLDESQLYIIPTPRK